MSKRIQLTLLLLAVLFVSVLFVGAASISRKPILHVKATALVMAQPPDMTVIQGQGFSYGLAVTGGVTPYTCTLGTDAPTWASISYLAGFGCVVTGTVPATQTISDVTFTVTVTDALGATSP